MRLLIALVLAALPAAVQAQEREVEDWKHKCEPAVETFLVQGVSTCRDGRPYIRLYRSGEEGREFIGVAEAAIRGHIPETRIGSEEDAREVGLLHEIDGRQPALMLIVSPSAPGTFDSHDIGSQSSIALPSGSWMRAKRPMPSISLSSLTSMPADASCAIIASRSVTRKFSMKVLSVGK